MKNRTINQHKNQIDSLFEDVKKIQDVRIQSEFSKYLCILVSGFIEKSIITIFYDYARNKSQPYVVEYVQSQLNNFQNAKSTKIIELAGKFNRSWANQIEEEFLQKDQLKCSIDSVVNNRCKIAHGENVGVSFVSIKDWCKNIYEFIEKVDKIINC